MLSRRSFLSSATMSIGAPSLLISRPSAAQQEKITRFIVGFPAGGGTDILARAVAGGMQAAYPAGLIIENRPGASSRRAVEYVKTSPPDGSTMLFTPDFVMTMYPHIYRNLAYDPMKDFVPVAPCTLSTLAFSVGPSVPDSVKTPADFIQWCKAHPSQAAFASTSPGTSTHFAGLMFAHSSGLPLLHVPYKGGAPALQDLMGGQIASSFNPISEVIPLLSSGRMRVLATTGKQRSQFLPDVPTFIEAGYKDVVVEGLLGVFMPAGTPKPNVDRASAAINGALALSTVKDSMVKFGMSAIYSSPEAFAQTERDGIKAWGPVIKDSGFTAEE